MAHQHGFSNFNLIWQYFTMKEWPFVECNICHQYYNSYTDVHLTEHLKDYHYQIIEQIKEEIKSTWLSLYFAFDIKYKYDNIKYKYDSIRCIFCEKDINIFHGKKYLEYHMHVHNINESTINFLKHDDVIMQRYLPAKIYKKIIYKVQDEITSAGLSLYFVLNGYTKMECVICDLVVNIFSEKQILRDHLLNCHNISK